MHAAPVRLHGAIATRLQAIVTESSRGWILKLIQAAQTLPFEICAAPTCGWVVLWTHLMLLLGRGCVDMDAGMVDDSESI
jgi:hypothetical protein